MRRRAHAKVIRLDERARRAPCAHCGHWRETHRYGGCCALVAVPASRGGSHRCTCERFVPRARR